MEPTEPISRIPPPSPPPSTPPPANPFSKLLSILAGFKDDLFSFFSSLSNRGNYINIENSEPDKKIQTVWNEIKPSSKKQQFEENLTTEKTFSLSANKASVVKAHKRRKNEEQSNIRRVGPSQEPSTTPQTYADKMETYLKRAAHRNLQESEIDSILDKASPGSFLINLNENGYTLFLKKNDTIEIHSFSQLEDEEGTFLDIIESKTGKHEDYEFFLKNIGTSKEKIILTKGRLKSMVESSLQQLTKEEGIKLLSDKPNKSFMAIPSDNSDYTYALLIKKESIIPFIKPSYDVVYFKVEFGNEQTKGKPYIVTNNAKNRAYLKFENFLTENGTQQGKGLLNI